MVLNLIPSVPDRYEHVVELGEEFVEIKMVEFCIVWLCYGILLTRQMEWAC